ncbi:hypothetical protein KPH14_005664 [Odynerus spinipes]|uniref:Uncharacterized protein n=1 Tax=Odynerus spinipes TaxID=1348599 RepID=A0AAD9RAR4_9HYME|nr:hypothetical protein KPH14_005664 [Odynerus spinipes]
MCSSDSKDKLIPTFERSSYVLKIFNNRINYLSKYNISASQINALQLHREKNGPYNSLQDVLRVEGMDEHSLNKFLHLVISDKQYKKQQRFKKSIITPSIDSTGLETVSTILGIYIGTNIVTWTLLELGENVLEWNYESFADIPDNKNTLNLLHMAWELNSKLPESDIYVVDNTNYDPRIARSILSMKAFLQKQQLQAMILALLGNRNLYLDTGNNEVASNIYLTHHEKIAALFGIRIGNEITSSKVAVNKLLYERDGIYSKEKNPVGVYAPKNILNIYQNLEEYVKDQMNWSLLTALTFLQLGVLGKYDYDFI